jgi:N-acetylglucosamine kinase-like BadF-type ATPase
MNVRAAVLAVDGGNSKADVVLVARDGQVLAARRGPTVSHQQVGLDAGVASLAAMARDLARGAGMPRSTSESDPVAEVGSFCLAGADFPAEVRRLRKALQGAGIADRTLVRNDTDAVLRAGASRRWGVALVCGQGVNGIAVGRDGREARFDAVGEISGDWGGGPAVGQAGLAAAVRAGDGRGPRTTLARLVPAYFGIGTTRLLVRALYDGRVPQARIGELSPVVFAAAVEGDAVARGIVDRLAGELANMAVALARRTRLTREDPDVVLAGGVFRAEDPAFVAQIDASVRRVVPAARLLVLASPPVLGAALLGIDALGLPVDVAADAEWRLRSELAAGLPDER